jgi:glycosyltransferase involved in cell wall biosynthesis
MKRALIVSKVPSPFIAEIAEAVTERSLGWEMDVWFSEGIGRRGAHWGECVHSPRVKFVDQALAADKDATSWEQLIYGQKYDVIISLWPLHAKDVWRLKKLKLAFNAKVIFWHEPPIPRNWIVWHGKKLNYYILSRWLGIDMVWAIGHRALEYWPKVVGAAGFLIPYFSRLPNELPLNVKDRASSEKFRFVFSGQLVERNNIRGLVSAVEHLVQEGFGQRFEVVLFGNGPLRDYVEDAKSRIGNGVLTIDSTTPSSWSGRLDWLREADALLSPGLYSGWGLTIPEAMSLGVPVISTNGIESAKYFIQDGMNGFRIGHEDNQIAKVMRLFIEQPHLVTNMSEYCVASAKAGDTEAGAMAIRHVLEIL